MIDGFYANFSTHFNYQKAMKSITGAILLFTAAIYVHLIFINNITSDTLVFFFWWIVAHLIIGVYFLFFAKDDRRD